MRKIVYAILFLGVFLNRGEAVSAYAQLSSLATQLPPLSGATAVKMNSVDAILNIDISPNKDTVVIKSAGVYFIMAAAQIGATSPEAIGNVDVWMVKNGTGIPNSGTRMSVETGASTGVLVSQTIMNLAVGDKISTNYSATGPSLGLIFNQPDNEPAIPSIIFSIFKLD